MPDRICIDGEYDSESKITSGITHLGTIITTENVCANGYLQENYAGHCHKKVDNLKRNILCRVYDDVFITVNDWSGHSVKRVWT